MPANPKTCDAILKVKFLMLQKQNRIGARKLATRLCALLEVPENPALIPHFAPNSKVTTVVEAVSIWLLELMPHAEIEHSDVFDPIFAEALQRKLQSIPGAYPWN